MGVVGGRPTVDVERVYDEAWDAMQALAGFLSESDGQWFTPGPEPGELDCAVFGFTFLMMWFFMLPLEIGDRGGDGGKKWESLGGMVQAAGKGELEGHVRRMAERAGWGGVLWEGGYLVTRG